MSLNYLPETRGKTPDPSPNQNKNLHWIQRVITNYPGNAYQGPFGKKISCIDNIIKDKKGINSPHPYYGTSGRNLNPNGLFADTPYRVSNFNRNFYWIGELT